MNFEYTEDRRMLMDSLNRFISEQYSADVRNQIAYGAQGHSPKLYAQLAELGIIGALFPEEVGGFAGAGFDISVVFECLGRGIVPEPLLGALLVGRALILAGSDTQKEQLQSLMDGTVIAALAHDEPGAHYELCHVTTTAKRDGPNWMLSGVKGLVSFGEKADCLLVSARTSGETESEAGISLFLVSGQAAGITRRSFHRIDGGRASELVFDHVQVPAHALLGSESKGYEVLERVRGYALLALCSEALGAMDVAKDHTLEYLRTRKQFGAPIGSFQALQHRMVDVLLEVEQARSAVINAAAAIDEDDRVTREKSLAAAKYSIGRIGTMVAEESIQLHGGIGMTWELPLSHYAKRLVMIDHEFGDEDRHLARFIALSQTH
jgi:alkylation response protein AidB-like acyl-CoA dehydrogenase